MTEIIEINGVQYPVIVNFFVIGEFQKETGLTFTSLSDIENQLFLIEPLLYHAIRVGQIISKVPVTIVREDMPFLLSDNEIYSKFTNIISKFFPTLNEENKDKGVKKKKV